MNRISIVTICYNNPEELKTTIAHIDSQRLTPYEHIIIDGSTKPDIRRYLESINHPPYRKWISEPDKGISDAWNKGITRATGDVIHIQNSGDFYYDDTILMRVKQTFENNPHIQWLHGKYIQHKGNMWVISGKPFERSKLYRGFRTIGHPTMFVRKKLYEKHGLFDLNINISMDYDFLVRIADEPFEFIDYPLAVFVPGGLSNNLVKASVNEMIATYTHYHGWSLKNRLWGLRILYLNAFTKSRAGRWFFRIKNAFKKAEAPNLPEVTDKRTPGKFHDQLPSQ